MVLRLLIEHQLYAKLNKCNFFLTLIHYLGYVVSKEGIVVDSENIKDIMEWLALRNVDEIISFMVLACYYRQFIKRKGNNFEWTIEFQDSFEKLEQLLTNTLFLKISNPDKKFVVYKDTCKEGLDGVLMQ